MVVIGNRTKIKAVKNKVAPSFTVAETVIAYGKGVSKVGALIGMAVEKEIIKKSGSVRDRQRKLISATLRQINRLKAQPKRRANPKCLLQK